MKKSYLFPLLGTSQFLCDNIEDEFDDSLLFDKKYTPSQRATYALLLTRDATIGVAGLGLGLVSLLS